MNKKELNFILKEGEGQYLEFKEGFTNLDKEIVAFANANGGRIFLGIDDKNFVKGIDVTNKLKSQIQDIARNCDPNIFVELEEFENILIINVKEGENKPYSCKEGFYFRVGPNSQKMKRNEIIKMIKANMQFNFDDNYVKNEGEFDYGLFRNFLRENKLDSELDIKDVLRSMNLIDLKNKFSNASILLFGKNPQSNFPSAYLECVLVKGSDRSDVLDRKRISGTLFNQLREGMLFLKKHLKVRYEFPNEKRKEIYDVPLRALEEALVNALIHRDYFVKGANISLFIYSDRVEVISPGGLAPGLNEKDFGKFSVRRNELIADVFSRTKYVEKIGSGIGRMKSLCFEQNNSEPVYEFGNFFVINFPFFGEKKAGKNVGKNVDKNVGKNVGKKERQELILERIKEEKFNQREFALEVGVDSKTIERDVEELKDKIGFVGSKKGGSWSINPRVGSMNSRSKNEK